MYIIDKHKDFYDYYSHIHGEDKKVVYDRRGSEKITDVTIVEKCLRHQYSRFNADSTEHILLEIGNIQYLVRLFDFIMEKRTALPDECVGCSMELVRTFTDNKHYFDQPISIHGCSVDYHWNWKGWKSHDKTYHYDRPYGEVIDTVRYDGVFNPILAGTQLTHFLDPEKTWIEVQTYISSLGNDKDVSIPMTDVEKAEQYGFDKKTSFRNPIK